MNPSINQSTVDIEVKDQVSWITFGHPQQNSMSSHQLEKLASVILDEGKNQLSKVIVLKSGGDRTFCAGANFDELASITTVAQGRDFFLGFAHLILAMRNCGKLVIGRVQGKAVGGGVGLLAATDYCMATKWASIRLSELSLGIGPFVIEPAISRKAGRGAFIQLALNPSEWQPATWAKDKGLFQECFDHSDQLDSYLIRYLDKMTSYSVLALSEMKNLIWEGTEDWSGLLQKRAEKSAVLLLHETTQSMLKRYRGGS